MLTSQDSVGEAELSARLYRAGVGLTPGGPQGAPAGFYRLCHAAQSREAVQEASRRLGELKSRLNGR